MADLVNLNRFRKDRARREKRAQADANAVKFGRSLSERAAEEARVEKSTRELDQHRRDTGSEPGPSAGPDPDQD
ncbi:DUF4169 family protein [Pseudomonas sp. GX19020]|uniref:DUF4169 family protein n=1 Tax=Pseudomonadota TaxID=1224 RepID=UPI000898177A|nr:MULTISPECIES: DUF4169 family protein [Pseudomonadota]MCL4065554.1 DUF4169 family protein [Pseudomonas sp. GX19020]SEB73199.1 protein of unknown function [Rhodobacter sp. 24-YEA-8]